MSRQFLLAIAYTGLSVNQFRAHPAWVLLSCITDLVYIFILAAHLRSMIKVFSFTSQRLMYYKAQRMCAPILYLVTAAAIVYKGNDG